MGIPIPDTCGAILLPETVLFPQGTLPLHIFEPRYREMLDDALQTHCMICVGSLTSNETPNPADCTERVGSIGLIRISKQTDDGRSNLVLHGVARVEFGEWQTDSSYPLAEIARMPSWSMQSGDMHSTIQSLRESLSDVMLRFPAGLKDQIDETLDSVDDPATLADMVAHQFVREQAIRRKLLEEPSVERRYSILTAYLRGVGAPDA